MKVTIKPAQMIIVIAASMLSFFAAYGGEAVGGNLKQAKIESDREAVLDTIAYINQMNYAFMVMETYHNVLTIQEEYDRISLDQIDVTRIPPFSHGDKPMKVLIQEMLDALKALKMTEEDYKRCQELLEDNRRRAKKEMVAGMPIVTWDPDLNTNGVVRTYKVYGKETLEAGGEWQYPTNSLHRFFKVEVGLP